MEYPWDFQVGGYGFRAATSDRFPYARATAPFRKEQFDSAPTVGDQSLAGWWTRGQLSFHKGAGVKYYEVLDGDGVLSRARNAKNVILSTPGQASLGLATQELALDAVSEVARVKASSAEWFLAYCYDGGLGTNTLKSIQANAAWSSSTVTDLGVSGSSLTASASTVYYKNGLSIYKWVPGAAPAALWTHGTDSFSRVHWGKGRLWAVDGAGRFYMLTTVGGAVGVGDSFGSVPDDGGGSAYTWTFATTPSVILAAYGPRVYSIGVDESSGAPVPASPRMVAELPSDEPVQGLSFQVGHVVIATQAGVRFGQMDASGGFVYGPPVGSHYESRINFTGKGYSITSSGTKVLVAGSWARVPTGNRADGIESGVMSFDMANMVDDLQPAWSGDIATANTQQIVNSRCGVLLADDGEIVHWDNHNSLYRTSSGNVWSDALRASTGVIDTGLHRFGTLDLKHFQSVTVRYDGGSTSPPIAGGSIVVQKVLPNGTVSSLTNGTITVQGAGQVTIDLEDSSPRESLGLRFTLNLDGSESGPVLLGYQIKALPSPKRQRLIKWPVVVADVVKTRYGTPKGTRGDGWKKWAALEAMEEADALVTYTDHRTGETGEAYIESLELQTDTPTKFADGGFGGIGYVTLRKVS